MGESAKNVMPFKPVTHGDLHRAVKGQISAVDSLQEFDRRSQNKTALQQAAPKSAPRQLHLPGKRPLFLARQQRKLPDLTKIETHGIVGPRNAVRVGLLARRRLISVVGILHVEFNAYRIRRWEFSVNVARPVK